MVVVRSRSKTLVGEISAFLMVTMKYDNTRSLRIKQSDGKCVRLSYAETSFNLHEME